MGNHEFEIPIVCNSGVGDVDKILEKTAELLVKNFLIKNKKIVVNHQ